MGAAGGGGATEDEHQARVVLRDVPPEEVAGLVEQARRVATEHQVDLERVDESGFEPITTVTLVLFGSAAAVGTVAHLVDQARGGQVIDLRAGADPSHYRSRDVQYGLVVVHAADGTVSVEVKEPKGMFGQVVDALRAVLTDLGKAGVDAVAASARQVAQDVAGDSSGDKVAVTTG